MKQRYAAGHQQQENKSILLFRMGRIVCFHLLRPSAAQENEWMKEEKTKWKFVFDEWMVSFLAEQQWESWWIGLACFSLGGYGLASQPMLRKERDKPSKPIHQLVFFSLSLWKELEWMEMNDNGIQQRNEEMRLKNEWEWNWTKQMSLLSWNGMSLGPLQVKLICFFLFFIFIGVARKVKRRSSQEREKKR